MKLEIIPKERRAVLEQMFQLYLHDMSEFMGGPLSRDGRFDVPVGLLDPYWTRPDHWPYFIMQRHEIIGFSLVRRARLKCRDRHIPACGRCGCCQRIQPPSGFGGKPPVRRQ